MERNDNLMMGRGPSLSFLNYIKQTQSQTAEEEKSIALTQLVFSFHLMMILDKEIFVKA